MGHIYVSPMSAQKYANPLDDRRRNPKPKKITHIFDGLYTKIGKTAGDCRSRNWNGSHFYFLAIGEDDVIAIQNVGRDYIDEENLSSRYMLDAYDDLILNLYAWEIGIDSSLMDTVEKFAQYLANQRYGLASPRFKRLNEETNEWREHGS